MGTEASGTSEITLDIPCLLCYRLNATLWGKGSYKFPILSNGIVRFDTTGIFVYVIYRDVLRHGPTEPMALAAIEASSCSRLNLNKTIIRIISTTKCYFRCFGEYNRELRICQLATCDDLSPRTGLCLPPYTIIIHVGKRRQTVEPVCAIVNTIFIPSLFSRKQSQVAKTTPDLTPPCQMTTQRRHEDFDPRQIFPALASLHGTPSVTLGLELMTPRPRARHVTVTTREREATAAPMK
ncbi:hypothetical protein TNCV_2889651 [Trichonephila clavipes]|nr:hypothetical protein TNCV_2889651 [Trichonephila clavipes]